MSKSSDVCDYCGEPLPKREPPPYQNAPAEDLRFWSLEFRDGAIDANVYLDRLNQREAHYKEVLQRMDTLRLPDDMRLEMAEELRSGRLGIQGLIQAIDSLRAWVDSGDIMACDNALALAADATRLVNKAIALNWQSFKTIQESTEEFLEAAGYTGD